MEQHDEMSIRALLSNLDIKLVLQSENDDYQFEYATSSVQTRDSKDKKLSRTYRLIDLQRGYETANPWDNFDLDKQTTLVANLIRYGRYRVVKKIVGWKVVCPKCNGEMSGQIWELPPRVCRVTVPTKCGTQIAAELIVEIEQE